MDNILIKVKSEEHSRDIIKWFKSMNVDVDGCVGIIDPLGLYDNIYCGIIGGRFDFYYFTSESLIPVKVMELP